MHSKEYSSHPEKKLSSTEAVVVLQEIAQRMLRYGNDGGEASHVMALIPLVKSGEKDPNEAVKEARAIYNSKNDV